MIAAAKRGEFDIILVHKSDRAFRNRDEAATYRILLRKAGVRWASVTESFFGSPEPTDKLLSGIMESVNEFYSDNLRGEVRKGIRSAAVNKGRQHGTPPYGYRRAPQEDERAWVVCEEEAERVRYIYSYYAEQSPTLCELCAHLNALGWPSPGSPARGTERYKKPVMYGWRPQSLRRLLLARTYQGEITHHGTVFPGSHAVILENDIAEKVHEIVRRRAAGRAEVSPAPFGGGILRCPHCDAQGVVSPLRVCVDRQYTYYRCGRSLDAAEARRAAPSALIVTDCPGYRISEAKVMRLLNLRLKALLNASNIKDSRADLPALPAPSPGTDRIIHIKKELAGIPQMRENYIHLFATSRITEAQLDAYTKTVTERETQLHQMLVDAQFPVLAPGAILSQEEVEYLLDILTRSDLTPRQRRDRLREQIEFMVPATDKDGLQIVLVPSKSA